LLRQDLAIALAFRLESIVRPILGELASETGLDTLYLTRIHWADHEQEILASLNLAPDKLFIPEQVKLDYSDAVCRYVIEGAPDHSDDVPIAYPDSDLARFLGFQSFVSAPVELPGGEIFGTLCGASTRRVSLSPEQVAAVRRQARRIAGWLAATE
jgi:diguanylate cyclase